VEDTPKNQQSKTNLADNLLKGTIILAILLVSFAIFYRYVFYLPQKEKLQKQEEESREQKLEKCLLDAKQAYFNCWGDYCEEYIKKCRSDSPFYSLFKEDCQKALKEGKCEFLPKTWAEHCEEYEKTLKDECSQKFK
jgi:hypothetical protein